MKELKQRSFLNLSERDLLENPWKHFSDQQCLALAEIFISIVKATLAKKTHLLNKIRLNLSAVGLSEMPLSVRALHTLSQLDQLNLPKDRVKIDTLLGLKNFGMRSLFELVLWLEKLGVTHSLSVEKEEPADVVEARPDKREITGKRIVESEPATEEAPLVSSQSLDLQEETVSGITPAVITMPTPTSFPSKEQIDVRVRRLHAKNIMRQEFNELIDRMAKLLDGEIAAEDLRFGVSVRLLGVPALTPETLRQLRTTMMEDYRTHVTALKFIVLGCERIARNSLLEEIREIVFHASLPDQRERNCDIYLEYFGWAGVPDISMEAVGIKYALTRERIRQLIAKTDKNLASHPIYSPLIRRLSRTVLDACPIRDADITALFRAARIDQALFPLSALNELFDKLRLPSFALVSIPSIWETFVVDESREQAFFALHTKAENTVQQTGVASVADIRKGLASRFDIAYEEAVVFLSKRSDVNWLDESMNHFTLRSITTSAFHKRYHKILSAVWCIRMDDLLEMLLPSLPKRVPEGIYRTYFERTPGLTLLPSGFIIVDHAVFGNSLSHTEDHIVDILHTYGGVIKRQDLFNELSQRGIDPATIFPIFTKSPAIVPLKRGLLGLPGTKLR